MEYFRLWPWQEKVLEILTMFSVLVLGVMMIELKWLRLGTTCPTNMEMKFPVVKYAGNILINGAALSFFVGLCLGSVICYLKALNILQSL